MKLSYLPVRTQKLAASVLHLLFLAVMFCGIGFMYLNDNYGAGIVGVKNVPYEETESFSAQFNRDLSNIFHYIEYLDVFENDDSLDASKILLRMTFGPNETQDFDVTDLISFLEGRGYRLTEDFLCARVSEPTGATDPGEGYVNWSASEPEKSYSGISPGMRRTTLEEISLEIMDVLHRYYATYDRLVIGDSNLHYKIEYQDPESGARSVYTNDPDLTPDTAKALGTYAYFSGDSLFYDTNFSIALSTIPSLSANNPYVGNRFYLLAGVDTAYPFRDIYSEGREDYIRMQNRYIAGFVLLVCGGLVALITLLFLIRISGRQSISDRSITLHGFDRTSTETGILFFSVLTVVSLWICKTGLVRISHLILPEDSWDFAARVLYTAVLYLGGLLLFFSLLRRYKAGTLWSGSLACAWSKKLSILLTGQSFTGRLTISFLGYLTVNTSLISLTWFVWDRMYVSRLLLHLLSGVVILACAFFNLWVFYLLYKRAADLDLIRGAVGRLAGGETSYQLDLDGFEGQELTLAEGINNLSAGLETALREKVKSERLKADLITNVSHDIKTPLTSILNYVNLIRREDIRDEKILRYLEVLEQKSQRLKTLTEDLVEASKASSGNIKLEISDIDLIELVHQTNGEFEEKFASRHLQLVTTAQEQESLIIEADGRRLWRILENLYNNAFKYAMENSRIYVDVSREPLLPEEDGQERAQAVFTIKNVSATPLNIRADELTERFVRGDVSRTTEGSGLGLAIAKDLTELQNGRFDLYIDGDLFKARVAFLVKRNRSDDRTIAVEAHVQSALQTGAD